MDGQTSLQTGAKRAHRNHDYSGLFPPGVYPTGDIDILEQHGHMLIIKSMAHGAKVSRAQERIFRLLTKFGTHPDAPGSITVLAVWGLGGTTRREWRRFDHMDTKGERVYGGDLDDWRFVLTSWWKEATA